VVGELGQGLIFILSQPRSGSTLLQRMLGAYPLVHTTQEPAIALYPLLGLQAQRMESAYRREVPHLFVRSFLQTLEEGEEAYVVALRKMLLNLYRSALATTQARFFLDKTPRYFMIIPELGRVFPKARYLILFRNPLAVLGSILNTWVRGEWLGVAHARPDLVEAPRLLLEGWALLGERAMTVQYERLVREPERTMQAICRYVDLDFDPALVEYNRSELTRWPHSDQKSVYRYTHPEPVQAEKWVESLYHPQVWRLSHDYLHALGGEIIQEMGYDFDELSRLVEAYAPSRPGRWLTFSLNWLSRRPPAVRPWWEQRLVWLVRRLHGIFENQ
jgi:hypothetical protein